MTAWIGFGLIGAMALAIAAMAGLVWVRVKGYKTGGGGSVEPPEGLEPPSYQPLARLMNDADLEFLRRQPPCGPDLSADWNRARRRIIRLFLNEIAADFRSLHAQARALVAEAPEQYAGLAQSLMRQQFWFWRRMAGIEARLLLNRVGLGAAEGRALIQLIDALRSQVTRSAAAAPAGA